MITLVVLTMGRGSNLRPGLSVHLTLDMEVARETVTSMDMAMMKLTSRAGMSRFVRSTSDFLAVQVQPADEGANPAQTTLHIGSSTPSRDTRKGVERFIYDRGLGEGYGEILADV